MTAPLLATRVMRARRPGICPLCRSPILVGQQIGKTGFWAHVTCIIARNSERPAEAGRHSHQEG